MLCCSCCDSLRKICCLTGKSLNKCWLCDLAAGSYVLPSYHIYLVLTLSSLRVSFRLRVTSLLPSAAAGTWRNGSVLHPQLYLGYVTCETCSFGRPLARQGPQVKPYQKRRALSSGGSVPELCLGLGRLLKKKDRSRVERLSTGECKLDGIRTRTEILH